MKNALTKIAALTIVAAGIASATCVDPNVTPSIAGLRVKSITSYANGGIPTTFVAAPAPAGTPAPAWPDLSKGSFFIVGGATSYGGNPNVSRPAHLSLLQQAFQIGANVNFNYCAWKENPGSYEIINLTIGN